VHSEKILRHMSDTQNKLELLFALADSDAAPIERATLVSPVSSSSATLFELELVEHITQLKSEESRVEEKKSIT
jgi:hypothetical protein